MHERGLPDFPPDSTGMKPHRTSRLQADDEDRVPAPTTAHPKAAFEPSAWLSHHALPATLATAPKAAKRFSSFRSPRAVSNVLYT